MNNNEIYTIWTMIIRLFVGQITVITVYLKNSRSWVQLTIMTSGRGNLHDLRRLQQDSMSPRQCQASIGWTQGGERVEWSALQLREIGLILDINGKKDKWATKVHGHRCCLLYDHGEQLDCIWIKTFNSARIYPTKTMSHLPQGDGA